MVKVGIYVKSYRPEQAPIIKAAMRRHFAQERLPASTWLGVESLALDGLLIEIDAVAIAERWRIARQGASHVSPEGR